MWQKQKVINFIHGFAKVKTENRLQGKTEKKKNLKTAQTTVRPHEIWQPPMAPMKKILATPLLTVSFKMSHWHRLAPRSVVLRPVITSPRSPLDVSRWIGLRLDSNLITIIRNKFSTFLCQYRISNLYQENDQFLHGSRPNMDRQCREIVDRSWPTQDAGEIRDHGKQPTSRQSAYMFYCKFSISWTLQILIN